MSKRTDYLHGRRGGRFVPDGYEATDFANVERCSECNQPMVVGQKGRHFACTPDTMVGTRCVCRPGCTVELVGDGPVDCHAECVPCRLQRNVRHFDVVEWRR